jgi:hypothetical protein
MKTEKISKILGLTALTWLSGALFLTSNTVQGQVKMDFNPDTIAPIAILQDESTLHIAMQIERYWGEASSISKHTAETK